MSTLPVRERDSMLGQVVRFSRLLHDNGVPVNPANLIDLCQCFSYVDISQRDDFHAAARATLVSKRDDLNRLDEVFAQFWESPRRLGICESPDNDESDDSDSDEPDRGGRVSAAGEGDHSDDGDERYDKLAYSADEVLMMTRDLGDLSDDDIERAQRFIKELVAAIANRTSRRFAASKNGQKLDFRKLLRQRALYAADDVNELTFRRRRIKKAKLVLLCDVSGSMQRYSSFLIHFMYALRRELADIEVAVFSTRMTVITEFLQTKGVDGSLKQVAARVHDWAGGTNIGGSIKEFNDHYAEYMLRSHAVVILLSDGWDRGDACQMRMEMQRLRRRIHKLLWLNPLLGLPGYQPLCRGMRTALPYLDYFLPGHNLLSFTQLVRMLRSIRH